MCVFVCGLRTNMYFVSKYLYFVVHSNSVESLGKHVINATANAENGSVWSCDNNIMKPVVFQKYWRLE